MAHARPDDANQILAQADLKPNDGSDGNLRLEMDLKRRVRAQQLQLVESFVAAGSETDLCRMEVDLAAWDPGNGSN